jgi:phage FluMu protein Com
MYRTLSCTKCQETRQILLLIEGKLYIACAKCGTIIEPISNEQLIFENDIESCGIYKIQLDSIDDKLKFINIPGNERDRIREIFREEYARIQKVFKEDYERIVEASRIEYDRIRNLAKEELIEAEKVQQATVENNYIRYLRYRSNNQHKEAQQSRGLSL